MVQHYDNTSLKNSREDVEVSIIIPVFNEEKAIATVLRHIERLLEAMPPTEVVLVDDGSKDGTANEIAKFPFVNYVRHLENRGKGAAICTGFKNASGKVIVIQDADMEYSPFDIPKLLAPILDGHAEAVFGSRFKGRSSGMSFSHHIGNTILSLTSRLLYGTPITDVMTGHKCLKREVVESLNLTENGFGIEVEMTAKILNNGWRIVEVPITYTKRFVGRSKIRKIDGFRCMKKLVTYAFTRNHNRT